MNYLVLAPKRSGHHAVIEWIAEHTGQKMWNDCFRGWENKELMPRWKNDGTTPITEGIVSIEDFDPEDWDKYNFKSFPFVQSAKVVTVIRNPLNWLASSYAKKNHPKSWHRIECYENLNKGFVNLRGDKKPSRIDLFARLLKWGLKNFNKHVSVSFDLWFESKIYREILTRDLGFDFSEKADQRKQFPAVNSSFDGMSKKGIAEKLEVTDRHKVFKDDPEYNKLFHVLVEKLRG